MAHSRAKLGRALDLASETRETPAKMKNTREIPAKTIGATALQGTKIWGNFFFRDFQLKNSEFFIL